jgi:phosphoribosylglycinamide formyltransferase 2
MSPKALAESQRVAKAVTDALGGRGLFGVELFVKGDRCGSAKCRRARTTPAW